jgi:3-methyladenine DNA glycosylase Mpg
MEFEIGSSHRIGVNKDLDRKLRFFIKGNKYVSR